jgi:hypothetical protein
MSKIRIGNKNRFGGPTAIGDHAQASAREDRDTRMWAARHPWVAGFILAAISTVIGLALTLWLT